MPSELVKRLRKAARSGFDELNREVMETAPRALTEAFMEILGSDEVVDDNFELVAFSWVDGKHPDHELLECSACGGEPVEDQDFCHHCGGVKVEYPFAPMIQYADIEPWIWHDFLVSKGYKRKTETERNNWSFVEKSFWVTGDEKSRLTKAILLTHDSPQNNVEFFSAIGVTIRQMAFHLGKDPTEVADELLKFWKK